MIHNFSFNSEYARLQIGGWLAVRCIAWLGVAVFMH